MQTKLNMPGLKSQNECGGATNFATRKFLVDPGHHTEDSGTRLDPARSMRKVLASCQQHPILPRLILLAFVIIQKNSLACRNNRKVKCAKQKKLFPQDRSSSARDPAAGWPRLCPSGGIKLHEGPPSGEEFRDHSGLDLDMFILRGKTT